MTLGDILLRLETIETEVKALIQKNKELEAENKFLKELINSKING